MGQILKKVVINIFWLHWIILNEKAQIIGEVVAFFVKLLWEL